MGINSYWRICTYLFLRVIKACIVWLTVWVVSLGEVDLAHGEASLKTSCEVVCSELSVPGHLCPMGVVADGLL